MTLNPKSSVLPLTVRCARAAAVLLTFGLFTVGSMPTAGHSHPLTFPLEREARRSLLPSGEGVGRAQRGGRRREETPRSWPQFATHAPWRLPGAMHWVAHLAAYAVIAFAFGLGWSVRPAVQIAVFVATIGMIHEATETITHSHAFETEDAIVNAIGALIGVVIQRTMQRAIT